jgi:DNA-binding response OmpR family regulator
VRIRLLHYAVKYNQSLVFFFKSIEMSDLILLVDDDVLLRRTLAFNLEQAGYRVNTNANAEDAFDNARRTRPDLVLLDIGLPGMDGLEALRFFRDKMDLPVIFITARRRELDEVLGLELGAEDYITKPFDISVLLARIKVTLRRSRRIPDAQLEKRASLVVGDLALNPTAHLVTLGGQAIDLSPREFDILHTMMYQASQVISTDELLANVWGAEFEGQPQVVYVHIRRLREKLEDDPNIPERILTIRGIGYKFQPKESV